jgi:hypothetical protein
VSTSSQRAGGPALGCRISTPAVSVAMADHSGFPPTTIHPRMSVDCR